MLGWLFSSMAISGTVGGFQIGNTASHLTGATRYKGRDSELPQLLVATLENNGLMPESFGLDMVLIVMRYDVN